MLRILVPLILLASLGIYLFGARYMEPGIGDQSGTEFASMELMGDDEAGDGRVGELQYQNQVYDLSLSDPQDLQDLLTRLDSITKEPNPAGHSPGIALVLHGPEVEIFSVKNYSKYHDIVDLAAKLDAFGVIDVKMCQTTMRVLGLGADEVPGFIEQVPFGPAEVERLRNAGYVLM